MPTKLTEVFEWYQVKMYIEEDCKLYRKAFLMLCNN